MNRQTMKTMQLTVGESMEKGEYTG